MCGSAAASPLSTSAAIGAPGCLLFFFFFLFPLALYRHYSHSRELNGYSPPYHISSSTKQSSGCALTPPSPLNLSHPPIHPESLAIEVFPAASVPRVKLAKPPLPWFLSNLFRHQWLQSHPHRPHVESRRWCHQKCPRAALTTATQGIVTVGWTWWTSCPP
jgi:hypothetical protein